MAQTTTDRLNRVLDNPSTEGRCSVCDNDVDDDGDPDFDGRCADCVGAGQFPWNCKARWA